MQRQKIVLSEGKKYFNGKLKRKITASSRKVPRLLELITPIKPLSRLKCSKGRIQLEKMTKDGELSEFRGKYYCLGAEYSNWLVSERRCLRRTIDWN